MSEPSDAAVWRGRLSVLVAAILWSTGGFFAKAPIFSDWPPESRGLMLAFWRALFASLILILLVRRVQWSVRLIPMTLAYAVMNWTYLNALVLLEPILVPVWVYVAWRNAPDYQFPAATTLAGGGCILVGLVLRYWGAQRRKRLLQCP